ncbi:MAG TPA: hypothetical protein ENN25_00660 [Euryarchaeota archaeon]|nr:hypothetical protein [Euryarchaeota archaeon]
MKIRRLLSGISLYLLLGFFLGLIVGDPTGQSGTISMIALGAMMTLSMAEIRMDRTSFGSDLSKGLIPAVMCFGVLTPIFLLTSVFFEGDFRTGWIMAAAMPAGVMIVPYASVLRSDMKLALYGELAIYLIALIATPVIAYIAIGASVSFFELFWILLVLILVPLGLSRVVISIKLDDRVRTRTMNFIMLFFFMIVVGANRSVFFEDLQMVVMLVLASFATIFGTGLLLDRLLSFMDKPRKKTITMFGTIKNTGLAIAICLTIFPEKAAMPATMLVIFEMVWIIFLISWKYDPNRDFL